MVTWKINAQTLSNVFHFGCYRLELIDKHQSNIAIVTMTTTDCHDISQLLPLLIIVYSKIYIILVLAKKISLL